MPSLSDIKNENISSATWLLGAALVITLVAFVQRIINDLQLLLGNIFPPNTLDMLSPNTAQAIASVAITLPLCVIAVLVFLTFKHKKNTDPYKLTAFGLVCAMGINFILMLLSIMTFLNDVNSTITTYVITLAIIAALIFGIIKIQEHESHTTEETTIEQK